MPISSDPGVTPSRKTHIVFDPPEPSSLEPAFTKSFEAKEMAAGKDAKPVKVRLANLGWKLVQVQDNVGQGRTSVAGQEGLQTVLGGLMQVPATYVETNTFTKKAGGTYGADATAAGDPMWQEQIPAGGTPQALTADQTAVPEPARAYDIEPLDRVAVTVNSDNEFGKVWRVKLIQHGAVQDTNDILFTFHFTGPASTDKYFVGFGQYNAMFAGDGQVYIYEKGEIYNSVNMAKTVDWSFRRGMRVMPAGNHYGRVAIFEVETIYGGIYKQFPYGAIEVRLVGGSQSEQSVTPGLLAKAGNSNSPSNITAAHSSIPAAILVCTRNKHGYETTETPGRVKPTQNRISKPRNSRPAINLHRMTFAREGSLRCDAFGFDFDPVRDNDIRINFAGDIPAGTTLTVKLFDAKTDVECTSVSSTTYSHTYKTNIGQRFYYPVFYFTSSDGVNTPTLCKYQAARDGTIEIVDPGEFEVDNLAADNRGTGGSIVLARSLGSEITITKPEADPSVESSSFQVDDLVGILPRLQTRALLGVRIETEYDRTHPEYRSILFRGRAVNPRGIKKGRGTKYPCNWRSYACDAVGPWQRLAESYSTRNLFDWSGIDPATGERWRVTTAVRYMLGWAGFPDYMIDVPDLPLKFWPNGSKDTIVAPLANWGDLIVHYVRQWLGMRLVFDENAGDYGMWRVKYAPKAPYNYFCHFVTTAQPVGRAVHLPASYGVDPDDGRPIIPIRAGTLTTWHKPLEFNKLILTTTGIISGLTEDRHQINQVFYNFKSYNFAGLDPSDPNYPDPTHPDYSTTPIPAYVIDPTIGGSGSEEEIAAAVNWFGRRMMAIAGTSKRGLKFQAALPLALEVDDALSTVPRPPAYYDACTVDGATFLMRAPTISYRHDRMQFAFYEVEAPGDVFL